jgi:glycosyltransferase involved in cell wall biosynthesis
MEHRLLHVSNSPCKSLADLGPTRAIIDELARGCAQYHVLAPYPGRPRHDADGVLRLHTVPARRGRTFALTSAAGIPLVRRHRLDAIICQDPLLGGVTAIAARQMLGTPVLAELHTDLYFRLAEAADPGHRSLARLALWSLRQATLVRAIGPRQTHQLVAHGVDRGRIRIVPYRVDTELFSPGRSAAGRGEVVLSSVGRFVAQKGYLELLDAFHEFVAAGPRPTRLVLAGGGPLAMQLRAKADALGIGSCVELRGWTSQTQVRDLLRSTDVYLQPSVAGRGDWMPRAILEAMATGLPVVATDVGGIADVLEDGRHGRLVPPGDRASLVTALRELVEDAELRVAMGEAALVTARSAYAWDPSFEAYRALLAELVAGAA